jgi:SPP1 gp7 family putative phage head morphogenesis protein
MIAQKDFANIGLSTSGTLLNLIDTNWNRLEVDAINGMIGRTAEGSPLYNLFMDRFSVNVDKAVNSLVDGISRGLNPNEVARNMRSMLDISIYDSTRITRTEALNVYRNVAYNQYVSSGIVDSYNWITEQGACSVCLGFSRGNPYPLSKIPQALHPFDRCSIAPNI